MKRTKAAWLTRGSAIALIAAAGFALSACSGSDGLTKAEEEALQEQLEEAERVRDEAVEDRDEAIEDRDEAIEDRDEAIEDRDEAIEDRDEAVEDRDEAVEDRDEAIGDRDEAQQKLTEAEQAEFRARASSFGAVLDLGTGGADEQGPVTVSWPHGSSLTFRPSGTLTSGSAAPPVPGGWRSARFTGQTGTADTLTDETVDLYTNIQAPSTRAFWKRYGVSIPDISTISDHASLATGRSAQATTETPAGTTTTNVTELTVSGSFDGAGGSFTCATGCAASDVGSGDAPTSAEINAHIATHVTFSQGQPTFTTPSNWTFKPRSIASGVPLDQDDAFLYFGIWSSIPDNISGTTYNFRYVAGGGAESGSTNLVNFNQLTGSATFRGGAVGRYVTQGQVGGQNAKIGDFTATATLNVDFGAADAAGTLSGSITGFHEDGRLLEGWGVTLGGGGSPANVGMPVDITLADNADDASGITVANIGGLPVAGSWGANFYGHDNAVLSDRTKYPANQYPVVDLAGVAGWFDATGTSASLAGAFAATPQ